MRDVKRARDFYKIFPGTDSYYSTIGWIEFEPAPIYYELLRRNLGNFLYYLDSISHGQNKKENSWFAYTL